MFIPYSTDAPVYHFPKATIGLIATNVVVHVVARVVPPEQVRPFLMELGTGLHPLQWLTHNFLHADFFHILFNMIFLWSYGIIIEGKLGWLAFLACYLGIGTAHGAVIQAAFLGADRGYVLGASAAIFGLMAMAQIWAPRNEFSIFVFLFIGFRVIARTFDVPIYAWALFQIVTEGATVGFQAMMGVGVLGSSLLHLSGALWGLVLGVAMVKLKLVDCEGWDVFALAAKSRKLKKDWEARGKRLARGEGLSDRRVRELKQERKSPEQRAEIAREKIAEALSDRDPIAFLDGYERLTRALQGPPPAAELKEMIRALHAATMWAASVRPMREYLALVPVGSERIRLRLAAILVRDLERPAEALRVLGQIPGDSLTAELDAARRQLETQAHRRIEEGAIELDGDEF
jgi:membrane associated rhomboid family serine protease